MITDETFARHEGFDLAFDEKNWPPSELPQRNVYKLVSDKDLAKYRFALIQVSTFKQPSYIGDGMNPCIQSGQMDNHSITEDTIYEHQFAPEDALGLDHVDKSGKTRAGTREKAIVIRG